MELKEPTKCCKSPILIWISGKGYYMCPCGEFKARENGQPYTRRPFTPNLRKRK